MADDREAESLENLPARSGQKSHIIVPGSPEYKNFYGDHWGHLPFEENPFAKNLWGEHKPTDEEKNLKTRLDKSIPIIAVHDNALKRILNDGRVKSQYESGDSSGMLNHEFRAKFEERVFGYSHGYDRLNEESGHQDHMNAPAAEGMPNKARPIYGFLTDNWNTVDRHHDLDDQYGEHRIVLHKPNIWHRTTFTFGDSLYSEGSLDHPKPSPVQDPRKRSFPYTNIKYLKSLHYPYAAAEELDYTEAQFHGGINLDDIHHIRFRRYHPDDDWYSNGAYGDRRKDRDDMMELNLKNSGIPHVVQYYNDKSHFPRGSEQHKRKFSWQKHALGVQSYLSASEDDNMIVIAQSGPERFLVGEPGSEKAIVIDLKRGTASREFNLQSLLARGYWKNPKPGIDAEDLLRLVTPTL